MIADSTSSSSCLQESLLSSKNKYKYQQQKRDKPRCISSKSVGKISDGNLVRSELDLGTKPSSQWRLIKFSTSVFYA